MAEYNYYKHIDETSAKQTKLNFQFRRNISCQIHSFKSVSVYLRLCHWAGSNKVKSRGKKHKKDNCMNIINTV